MHTVLNNYTTPKYITRDYFEETKQTTYHSSQQLGQKIINYKGA
jgi:hypothetical protein